MRKTTKEFLMSLDAEAKKVGITDVTAFDEDNLTEKESVFTAEQIEKHTDRQTESFVNYLAEQGYHPYTDNWRLIKPHWYLKGDATVYSFEDIYKQFLIKQNESK